MRREQGEGAGVVEIAILRLEGHDDRIALPFHATAGAAGADIRANFPDGAREGLVLEPGARALVPTGLAMAIPDGFEVQVRPRSGLALKHGITLVNTPGTIDSDYRGPIGILLVNLGAEPFRVTHGERIAQLVVAPVTKGSYVLAETLDETVRGHGGFGSTGRG
ncbi:dUTP diphosphatase [Pseudooceanicola sp.]|jgi:dUTP pyrophosphatase|uniref:dUTP diphosphatase n=1 Tax=Pseudooceanicola TaxID=1679449 RepID=UPI000A6B701A